MRRTSVLLAALLTATTVMLAHGADAPKVPKLNIPGVLGPATTTARVPANVTAQSKSLPLNVQMKTKLMPPPASAGEARRFPFAPPDFHAPCPAGTRDCDGDGSDAIAMGGTDCDDLDGYRYPGKTEIADTYNHDEDCDFQTFGQRDADGDGYWDALACNIDTGGNWHCGNDCDDFRTTTNPNSPEVCDGYDNNCDGSIDWEVQAIYYTDYDGDGFGDPASQIRMCFPSGSVSTKNTDCNDKNPLIHPGQFELVDSVDNNCNGQVDEAPRVTIVP